MITYSTPEVKNKPQKTSTGSGLSASLVRLSGTSRHLNEKASDDTIFSALLGAGERAKGDAYMNCGQDTYVLKCESCGHNVTVVYHCKLRFCSRCASAKLSFYMSRWMPYMEALNPVNVRTLMLSIKNVSDLRAGVDKIRECFAKLRHRKYYKSRILGGLYGIEAKPGKDGKWNVHLHCVYYGEYIPRAKLSLHWKDITGDSWYVYVKQHRNARNALRYVLKYIGKGIDSEAAGWTGEDLVEFVMALADVRLTQAFGGFLTHGTRSVLECPVCGQCVWALLNGQGDLVFSALDRELRELGRSRPPPMVSLMTGMKKMLSWV